MSAEIIDPSRYKKITRKEAIKKKKNNKIKYSTKTKKSKDLKYKKNKFNDLKRIKLENDLSLNDLDLTNTFSYNNEKELRKKEQKKNKSKLVNKNISLKDKIEKIPIILKITAVIFAIFLIGIVSRKITSIENMPFVNVFSNKDKNINLEEKYNFKIGLTGIDTFEKLNTKNIILSELYGKTTNRLVKINKDYTIECVVANNVEKINNKEYIVTLNKDYDFENEDIINTINDIKNTNGNNIYFSTIDNIENAIVENKNIKIILKNEDPYFIYKLDFPIFNNTAKDVEYKCENLNVNEVNLLKNKSGSTLEIINIKNYNDSDKMVEEFRDDKIDLFFTSSEMSMRLIGKHEYNVKKYRDGETLFLLGNKNRGLYSLKEIRKALAYSLKREDIIKEVNNTSLELIDIPFIHSDIRYKYDVFGSENELLSNGWKKVNGVYAKEIDGILKNLELNLIVKDNDLNKLKVAGLIKDMAQNVGIKINVNSLDENTFNTSFLNKEYDIILADVYTNEYPDISYLSEYININENTNIAFESINNSKTKEELEKGIANLQDVLSEEVACIGIYAHNTNAVYQKYITGFEEIRYFNIFNNLENIGKLKEK